MQNIILEETLLEACTANIEVKTSQSCSILFDKKRTLKKKSLCQDSSPDDGLVIALQEKNGKIFLIIQEPLAKEELKAFMKISKDSAKILKSSPYFERWKSYQGIIINCYHFFLIERDSKNKGAHKMDLSQLFWNYLKRRLIIFNGVAKHHYGIFVKNSEFMFNHRQEDLYKLLVLLLAQNGHVLTLV